MATRPLSLLCLCLCLISLLLPLSSSSPNEIVAVLAARGPSHLPFLEAWMHSEHGLISLISPSSSLFENQTALSKESFSLLLSSSPSSVFLGMGSYPAFSFSGSLHYQISVDDGHSEIFTTEEWVLSRGAKKPFPVAMDDVIPEEVMMARLLKYPAVFHGDEGKSEGENGETFPKRKAPYKITVDPGHGGSDPGAVAQGYQEKDFTLDISLRLRDLLLADRGLWTVQMTRSTDTTVSLSARTTMANNWPADRFVSIHINSFTSSSANGLETYSYQEGSTSARLRDRIQQEVVKAWQLTNRGSKTANFFVLRETTMPATLSELGFITSPVDITKLADPQARQQIAAAHLFALQYHFGVSFNLPNLEKEGH